MPIKHKKLKLSGTRTKWLKGRDTTLRGTPTRINPQTVNLLADEVVQMVDKMHLDISSQLTKLFSSPTAKNSIQTTDKVASLEKTGMVSGAAMDASISSKAISLTDKLVSKWTRRFSSFGDLWTQRMIGVSEKQSAKDLGKSMKKLSGGLTIDASQISAKTRDKMLASADQASSLIKSIGPQYTTQIKEAVARSITDSSSSFEELQNNIQSMLSDKYKTHKNKAFNVAKDQTKKTYTNITASRMQEFGTGEYIWRHAGGSQHPRDYHRDVLNGQTFSLDNPPIIDKKTGERGKPGDAYFCNCYMEPVISFDNKK
tara:strand:+ start:263 stop:1204 length:942 start_codon:yes stop_codon:yes gene_type:complete